VRLLLLGATGTIGQAVAKALLDRGYHVVCPLRQRAEHKRGGSVAAQAERLVGNDVRADVRTGNAGTALLTQLEALQHERFDAIVSCLASRTGAPKDAWAVDYGMNAALLKLAQKAGIKHFVLLSAICVQKPLLAFQQAKLAFEHELTHSGLRYSIVRPTAFFKSLSGQLQRVRDGKPFMLFGDGQLTACKPISDDDLAQFIALCLTDEQKFNQILPIGGPGPAITPLEQGNYLFAKLGLRPRFMHVPVALLSTIIVGLEAFKMLLPSLADKAALAKIGRYYATESMLVWDATRRRYDPDLTPSFGTQTLFDHYDRLIAEGRTVDLGEHAVF
jgi:divinyl chlorophyllide a 8-vinyl-reductase